MKVRKFFGKSRVLAVSLSFLLAGCATIMHGTRQNISFSSSPSGATVEINGIARDTTPAIISLERNKSHQVSIDLEGYEPFQMHISNSVSGWVAGNIIFGGIIGLAVDAISGGLYKLSPEEVHARLDERSSFEKGNNLYITVTLNPESDWEKIGNLNPVSSN